MKPLNSRKHWTDTDIEDLMEMVSKDCNRAFIAKYLQRTEQSISNKLCEIRAKDNKVDRLHRPPKGNDWLHQTGAEEEQIEIDIMPPADSYVINEPVEELGEIERMPLDKISDKIDSLKKNVNGVESKLNKIDSLKECMGEVSSKINKIDVLSECVNDLNSKLVTMTIGMVALLVLFIVAFAY